MKTELEVHGDTIEITDVHGTMSIVIDIASGEVQSLDYVETDITTLHSFLNKSRLRYRKYVAKEMAM